MSIYLHYLNMIRCMIGMIHFIKKTISNNRIVMLTREGYLALKDVYLKVKKNLFNIFYG